MFGQTYFNCPQQFAYEGRRNTLPTSFTCIYAVARFSPYTYEYLYCFIYPLFYVYVGKGNSYYEPCLRCLINFKFNITYIKTAFLGSFQISYMTAAMTNERNILCNHSFYGFILLLSFI